MKRSPISKELSRDIVSSFLQTGGQPSPCTLVQIEETSNACQLWSPGAETAPDNTQPCIKLRWTTNHLPQRHHTCGWQAAQQKQSHAIPDSLNQQEKISTPTDDVLFHLVWSVRKSESSCPKVHMSYAKPRLQISNLNTIGTLTHLK